MINTATAHPHSSNLQSWAWVRSQGPRVLTVTSLNHHCTLDHHCTWGAVRELVGLEGAVSCGARTVAVAELMMTMVVLVTAAGLPSAGHGP